MPSGKRGLARACSPRGVDLGEGGVVVIPVVLGIDGLRLGGDDVPGGTGEVMPAEADKTRDARTGVVVYPVVSLIGFKIVRKGRVGVRINDARQSVRPFASMSSV